MSLRRRLIERETTGADRERGRERKNPYLRFSFLRGKRGSHTYKLMLSKSRRSLPPSSHSHEIGRRLTSSGDAILLMPFSPSSSSSFSPAPLSPRDGASSQGTEIHQRVRNSFFFCVSDMGKIYVLRYLE